MARVKVELVRGMDTTGTYVPPPLIFFPFVLPRAASTSATSKTALPIDLFSPLLT
jgi:hypothetical protein